MTDEPASLLLVYCDNILARILAQISANFHVKYKHYTLLRKSAFSEGSCRELVRPLYARANYKKALESQGHFLKNWATSISPPKSFFQNDSRTASLLSDQKKPTSKGQLFILPRSKLPQFHNLLTGLNSHTFALDKLRQNTIESIQYENVKPN